MAVQPEKSWPPTTFKRFEKGFDTSVQTARIVTDAGDAYIKCLGNPQGPHVLACELVGTGLAKLIGLPTLDYAILTLEEDDEIPFVRGGKASPGPAFVTRAVVGRPWSGEGKDLSLLDNLSDLSRLIVFDTWTLNCDRYPPIDSANPVREEDLPRKPNRDNVLFSEEGAKPGRFRLLAIDHTHCFTCGGDLTGKIAAIDRSKDERVYGLFPAFKPLVERNTVVATAAKLAKVTSKQVEALIAAIPDNWEVSTEAKQALLTLVYGRAQFVADRMVGWLTPHCWAQAEFEFGNDGGAL